MVKEWPKAKPALDGIYGRKTAAGRLINAVLEGFAAVGQGMYPHQAPSPDTLTAEEEERLKDIDLPK